MAHLNHHRPPVAKTVTTTRTIHGLELVDNYHWLRNHTNPEVKEYLKAENAYTDAQTDHTKPLQQDIYREILNRTNETDLSVPTRLDHFLYYSRTEKGRQYPIYCRKLRSMDAEEEVILDTNAAAAGHEYFRIGLAKISPDHRLLAYSTDTTGSECFTLHIKDLITNTQVTADIPNTHYSAEWANDNKTLFYATLSQTKRPYRLYRHIVGSDPATDILVYEEADEAFSLSINKTKSRRYLLMNLRSARTSEVHYVSADRANEEFKVIRPRQHQHEYEVHHHGSHFYILSNENARNFRLLKVPVSAPSKEHYVEIIPNRETVKLDSVELFTNHMAIYETREGLKTIRIQDLTSGTTHKVTFPESVYTYWRTANPDFNTTLLRFHYTSLVTPRSVFDYDMQSRKRELRKRLEIRGGYDPALYRSERVFARSPDGTRVPISLVYRNSVADSGGRPTLLHGYGAYGVNAEPFFTPDRLSLLDRGFIYAIAHVRGGGEMGRPWYENGCRDKKMNTFSDFIACAEHLVAEGYTARDQLAITGSSAGGLLVGAVINMRPDLFAAAIAKVPFVDVINSMLDPTLPLSVREIEEWGDPTQKEQYEYIKTYSPYHNVTSQEYPHLLVTASLNDRRVQYWEPVKWIAKLRALNKGSRTRLLLRTHMGAGHGGVSGRYSVIRETALEYAFLLDALGMAHAQAPNTSHGRQREEMQEVTQ